MEDRQSEIDTQRKKRQKTDILSQGRFQQGAIEKEGALIHPYVQQRNI